MPDQTDLRTSFGETYSKLLSPLCLFICGACWLVASLAGPFGTYEGMPLAARAVYWFAVIAGGVFTGFGVRAALVVLLGQVSPLRFDLSAAAATAMVFAPVVIALRHLASLVSPGLAVSPLSITVNTFFVALAVFILHRQLSSTEPGSYLPPVDDHEEADPATDEPRLMRRLPPEVQGNILRLSASDHHVEVVTERGTHSLRIRLADAIDETEPVEGYCCHRSHWVARAAIVGVERENAHKLFLLLVNGDLVPVSRKYRSDLEEAAIIAKG